MMMYNDTSANFTQRNRNKREVMCIWQINCQIKEINLSMILFPTLSELILYPVNEWLLGCYNEECCMGGKLHTEPGSYFLLIDLEM